MQASHRAARERRSNSEMIQNRLDDERKEKSGGIDRKLKRQIDKKKQAHGNQAITQKGLRLKSRRNLVKCEIVKTATVSYQRLSVLFNSMDRNGRYPCFVASDITINTTHMIYRE